MASDPIPDSGASVAAVGIPPYTEGTRRRRGETMSSETGSAKQRPDSARAMEPRRTPDNLTLMVFQIMEAQREEARKDRQEARRDREEARRDREEFQDGLRQNREELHDEVRQLGNRVSRLGDRVSRLEKTCHQIQIGLVELKTAVELREERRKNRRRLTAWLVPAVCGLAGSGLTLLGQYLLGQLGN